MEIQIIEYGDNISNATCFMTISQAFRNLGMYEAASAAYTLARRLERKEAKERNTDGETTTIQAPLDGGA